MAYVVFQVCTVVLICAACILAYNFPEPSDPISSKLGFNASFEFDILLFALFARLCIPVLRSRFAAGVYVGIALQTCALTFCLAVAYESLWIVGNGAFADTLFATYDDAVDTEAVVMWWLVLAAHGVGFATCLMDVQ